MSPSPLVLGIDEAGRGCVLGSLFVGAFCCTKQQLQAVEDSGATDSKKLSPSKRSAILEKLKDLGQSKLVKITPQEIDNGNINTLEEQAFIKLILHFRPQYVYIDAPAHPKAIPAFIARVRASLQPHFETLPQLIVEPKADLRYPLVGAASIVAKVNRDAALHTLGKEVGSGYPSDPKTRAWIKGFFERKEELPDCVRKRWGTIQTLRQQTLL